MPKYVGEKTASSIGAGKTEVNVRPETTRKKTGKTLEDTGTELSEQDSSPKNQQELTNGITQNEV